MFCIMNRHDFSNLGLKHTIMMMTMMMIIIAQKKTSSITTNDVYYIYIYIHIHTYIYGKSSYNLFQPKWAIVR